MMKLTTKAAGSAMLLLCLIASNAAFAAAQTATPQRDPLSFLRRALSEAGATALTTAQETQLTTLITAYQNAEPTEPDAALEAARTAYDSAILAGDLATANAQAAIIASRSAALTNTRLQAEAQFDISALAVLKSGGQLSALTTKFGDDRVLGIVGSLVGHGFGGHGGGHGRG